MYWTCFQFQSFGWQRQRVDVVRFELIDNTHRSCGMMRGRRQHSVKGVRRGAARTGTKVRCWEALEKKTAIEPGLKTNAARRIGTAPKGTHSASDSYDAAGAAGCRRQEEEEEKEEPVGMERSRQGRG